MKSLIPRNLDYLFSLAKEINIPDCLLCPLYSSDFAKQTGSGAFNTHHYGVGGLIQHTREVIEIALNNNALLQCGVSEKLIFIAGLWHDYAKIHDYEILDNGVIIETQYKRRIHHISGSAIKFNNRVAANPGILSYEEIDDITHAILAHHGSRALGSPVSPATPLAWLIHLADSTSALLNPQHTMGTL